MNIFSIIIISVVVSILAILIKQNNPAYSVLLIITFVVIIISVALSYLFSLTDNIMDTVNSVEYASEFLKILFKAIVICVLSDLASNICKDAGNNTVAVCIDVITKIILLSLSLPLVDKLVEIIQGLFNI